MRKQIHNRLQTLYTILSAWKQAKIGNMTWLSDRFHVGKKLFQIGFNWLRCYGQIIALGLTLGGSLIAVFTSLRAVTTEIPSDLDKRIEDNGWVNLLRKATADMREHVLRFERIGAVEAGIDYRRAASQAVDARDRLRIRLKNLPARDALNALDEALSAHINTFGAFERIQSLIGHNDVDGLMGSLAVAANRLEESIAELDEESIAELDMDRLMIWFLLMRLHEREYLISGKPALVERVQETSLNINFEIVQKTLPDDQRTEILQRLTDYNQAILSLADAMRRRRRARAQLVLHVERLQEPLTFLLNQINEKTSQSANLVTIRADQLMRFAWIIVFCAFAAATGAITIVIRHSLKHHSDLKHQRENQNQPPSSSPRAKRLSVQLPRQTIERQSNEKRIIKTSNISDNPKSDIE